MKYLHLILFCILSIHVSSQAITPLSYSQQLAKSKELLNEVTDSLFNHQLQIELTEKIFPYWYGTQWDYNGYTNKPKQGVIACGYFVSTTLKHLGFNLNRYDIAKMYSLDIVKVLCHNDYDNYTDITSFLKECSKLSDGIYVLGLSNHVGFLSIEKGVPYFIHSDYSSEDGVRKENVANSFSLENSENFWIGNFSNHFQTKTFYINKDEYLPLEK